MMFIKRLFSRKEKPAPEHRPSEHPLGVETEQTQAEQDVTREHMEAELADDRARRGATDVRPDGEQPPT